MDIDDPPTFATGDQSLSTLSSPLQQSTIIASNVSVEGVVKQDEIEYLKALGLGRGVDSTNDFLWTSKSSFQVRSIDPDLKNIIATEESGTHQTFEHDIASIRNHQLDLKLSIADPHTITRIGIDSELSRSYSKTKKAIGEKILTRTVSFASDFDDLPLNSATDLDGIHHSKYLNHNGNDFEQQLCTWILNRISVREKKETTEYNTSMVDFSSVKSLNVMDLARYLVKQEIGSKELHEISRDCYYFIKSLQITHYVYAIELGAMRYRVLALEDSTKFSGRFLGNELFSRFPLSSAGNSMTKDTQMPKSWVKEIGKIIDGTVKRHSPGEAVIGIQIKPISTLIKLPYICHALQGAVIEYTSKSADKSRGPYFVSCGKDLTTSYWKVEKCTGKVMGTPSRIEASPFYFVPSTDDSESQHKLRHRHRFSISYYGDDINARNKPLGVSDLKSKTEELAPAPQYITSKVSKLGFGPLQLRDGLLTDHSRFTLHSPVLGASKPVDLTMWINGEQFFINIVHRKFLKDSYIGMKTAYDSDGKECFITAGLPSVKCHDGNNVRMLFRLQSCDYKPKPTSEITTSYYNYYSPILSTKGLNKASFVNHSLPLSTERRSRPSYNHIDSAVASSSPLYSKMAHPSVSTSPLVLHRHIHHNRSLSADKTIRPLPIIQHPNCISSSSIKTDSKLHKDHINSQSSQTDNLSIASIKVSPSNSLTPSILSFPSSASPGNDSLALLLTTKQSASYSSPAQQTLQSFHSNKSPQCNNSLPESPRNSSPKRHVRFKSPEREPDSSAKYNISTEVKPHHNIFAGKCSCTDHHSTDCLNRNESPQKSGLESLV